MNKQIQKMNTQIQRVVITAAAFAVVGIGLLGYGGYLKSNNSNEAVITKVENDCTKSTAIVTLYTEPGKANLSADSGSVQYMESGKANNGSIPAVFFVNDANGTPYGTTFQYTGFQTLTMPDGSLLAIYVDNVTNTSVDVQLTSVKPGCNASGVVSTLRKSSNTDDFAANGYLTGGGAAEAIAATLAFLGWRRKGT